MEGKQNTYTHHKAAAVAAGKYACLQTLESRRDNPSALQEFHLYFLLL